MRGIDGPKKGEIINRQLCHFFRADIGLGMAIAQALGVNPEEAMPKKHAKEATASNNNKINKRVESDWIEHTRPFHSFCLIFHSSSTTFPFPTFNLYPTPIFTA